MSVIYEPRGMAREYSAYSCNLYIGCSHRCKYCYAPHALQRSEDNFFGRPYPRRDILKNLEADLKKQKFDKEIFLSFIGDVYCDSQDDSKTTREVLKLLNQYQCPVAILTKGGKKILRDLDVLKEFGSRISVGATLTFHDETKSKEWEQGASLPSERLEMLKVLHDNGVKTFVSFEPVIEPAETLKLIEATLRDDSVDRYLIGKLNNYKGLDKDVDWAEFLQDCLSLLRPAKKEIYIKKALREKCPNIPLLPHEVVAP